MAVACGYNFSAAVGENGSLFAFGKNKEGQLGTNDNSPRLKPSSVQMPREPVRQVAAGYNRTGIVTDSGKLFLCGRGLKGINGCNGIPKLMEESFFDKQPVLMVAFGGQHMAVVTVSGGVYTCGRGWNGQLGHGNESDESEPKRIPPQYFDDERIVMVAAGSGHTVALSEAGSVFAFGRGWNGQLGYDNNLEMQKVPRKVEPRHFNNKTVVFVAAGGYQTVAVTACGCLFTWGFGGDGQLGLGKRDQTTVPTEVNMEGKGEGVVMAACSDFHTLVVTKDGALWACGRNHRGQLGLNDFEYRNFFTNVISNFGGKKVVAAAVGYSHSAAVTEDGALWTWGDDDDGQLGHGANGDDGQLGHGALWSYYKKDFILRPKRVRGLGSVRIGRCRKLPQDHAMAFAMATHHKLGGGKHEKDTKQSLRVTKKASPANMLLEDLVQTIVDIATSWPEGLTKREEGLGRLLGGGLTPLESWPEPEAGQETQPAISTMSRALVKVCKPCRVSVSAQNL
jgi:alpha-tubulin suppressor-like RCC1 family protein